MNTQTHDIAAPPSPSRFSYRLGARPIPGYTIKRGVGRGGFGEVYYAVSDAGKEVALKLIRRNLDVELRGVTQCLNLKHPHLLALHDVRHDDEENCWVVMEFVSGESLEDALDRSPQGIPGDEVMQWMSGIAAGVSYLHDHGLVHRDLKPGNVFNDEGIIKLGDYGLSKFISCSRRSGQTESIGTVHYMAPEIANGRYGREIDIYALGVLLYEMLTGRVPFEGESMGEVLMKHLTTEPDVSRLPSPFRAVVAKALRKDSAERYSSVEEMMSALPAPKGAVAFWPAGRAPGSTWRLAAPGAVAHEEKSPEGAVPGRAYAGTSHGSAGWRGWGVEETSLARMLGRGWNRAVHFWRSWPLATPVKLVLSVLALGIVGMLTMSLIPLLIWAPLGYVAYRAFLLGAHTCAGWKQVRRERASRAAAHATGASAAAQAGVRHVVAPGVVPPRATTPAAPAAEATRTSRRQLAELLGALLTSALVAMVVGLVMVVLRGRPPQPEQYAWLTVVGTLGSWGVIVPAWYWKGRAVEPAMRRFVMLIVGMLLGVVAFALDAWLWIDLPYDLNIRPTDDSHIPKSFYSPADGAPLIYAYLAYFGFLLLLIRWWRTADPGRSWRFSLLSTLGVLPVAWLLNFVWPFPQPWGLMVAAMMAISVQLASPWQPQASERPHFRTANNI